MSGGDAEGVVVVDQLCYALGMCELLVPSMRQHRILLSVGRLLALAYGADHHYTASRQVLRRRGLGWGRKQDVFIFDLAISITLFDPTLSIAYFRTR